MEKNGVMLLIDPMSYQYLVFLHHRVVVALHFVESKTVLKSGAAATRDEYAQFQFGIAFLVDQLLDFIRGAVGENKRRGHLRDCIHISTPIANCLSIGRHLTRSSVPAGQMRLRRRYSSRKLLPPVI